MSALLGKKIGMTQVFTGKGDCVPVTVVHVERCVPVLKRTSEKDGYQAVMLAYGGRKPKHTNKPLKGFYLKHKVEPATVSYYTSPSPRDRTRSRMPSSA